MTPTAPRRLCGGERLSSLGSGNCRLLSTGGTPVTRRYADDIHEEGFAPLKKLLTDFVDAGGTIWICSPCFKKRGLDEHKLVPGATIVGGAKAVEFLSTGGSCMTY
jgi:predicted peroxiredoxin